jgi:putative ABC transport system permease protein
MKQTLAWFESLSQDVRLAVRSLRESPAFLAVVILSLGLGIGANSTIFSVMDVLLLRTLPYDHPEQLVTIYEIQLTHPESGQNPPIAESLDWKRQNHVFQDIALTSSAEGGAVLSGIGDAMRVTVQDVTPNLFDLLGVALALGVTRLISAVLFGVKPSDPLTYLAVALGVAAVACLACYIPARRATKVDPMVALRYE